MECKYFVNLLIYKHFLPIFSTNFRSVILAKIGLPIISAVELGRLSRLILKMPLSTEHAVQFTSNVLNFNLKPVNELTQAFSQKAWLPANEIKRPKATMDCARIGAASEVRMSSTTSLFLFLR